MSAIDSSISIPSCVIAAMSPCFMFMVLSLPVKSKNILHELLLSSLLILDLYIPIHFSGQLPYACLMSLAVWTWASGMKMGVWLFGASMQERQQRPFYMTMLDWRTRSDKPPTSLEQIKSQLATEYIDTKPSAWLWQFTKNVFYMDLIELALRYADQRRSVHVFQAVLSKVYLSLGQVDKAATMAPDKPLTPAGLLIGTLISMLFCVYVQSHLQVAYDECMLGFSCLYHCLPFLEKWQLGNDSQKLQSKDPVEVKTVLKRLRFIRATKLYLEETISMPPAFDSPWSAHSLRDFWGRRWHTYYNESFYRLGYRPVRAVMLSLFHCKPPRWLPALSVFFMSGLMHEYFLAATGSPYYLDGHPLPAVGLQFAFFVMQAVAIVIGDTFFPRGPISRLYTVFCMALTCYFFVVPYVLTGYLDIGRPSIYRTLINVYKGNPNILASVY
ncbi:membrane bound O-acyl transferase family-domain-containing protein [Blakeslea trispora]|nr:membrane bound O-acyl transferase family-domain-containing protein [Blakeslea trispora]